MHSPKTFEKIEKATEELYYAGSRGWRRALHEIIIQGADVGILQEYTPSITLFVTAEKIDDVVGGSTVLQQSLEGLLLLQKLPFILEFLEDPKSMRTTTLTKVSFS